jgi:hypothetical protein
MTSICCDDGPLSAYLKISQEFAQSCALGKRGAEVKSNSGAGLLSRIQESAEITDDEGALRLDHLGFRP